VPRLTGPLSRLLGHLDLGDQADALVTLDEELAREAEGANPEATIDALGA
jgi:hypothetical protein